MGAIQAMRVATLAERWDRSPGKIRAMIRAGEIPVIRLGTMPRVPLAAIIAFERQKCDLTAPIPPSHGPAAAPAASDGRTSRSPAF